MVRDARKAVAVFFLFSLFTTCFVALASAADLTIGNYQLISSLRINRTVWQYTYTASITNSSAVEYTNVQGERWAYPLWQQMLHQVNHATQHRSEAAVILTDLGRSPGLLDLLYFVDVQGAGAR